MIDRIVLLKLRDDLSNAEGRAEVAKELEALLASTKRPGTATIGLPADLASERSWDLAVTLSFDGPNPSGVTPEAGLLAALGDRLLLHKAWSFERC